MALLIPIIFFVVLVSLIGWAGYRFYAKPGQVFEQITPAASSLTIEEKKGPGFGVRIISQLGEQVPTSPEDATVTGRMMIAAGLDEAVAVPVYNGLRVIAMVLCLGLGLYLQSLFQTYSYRVISVIMPLIVGFFVPGLILDYLVAARQEVLRLALPDALDLMVVCVEAGLGLDQAIANVTRELALTHPEICHEFGLITLEMRAGKRRADALRHLADRTGEPELRKLVSVLVQTDRFGTSIADSLRTHSEFMRIRRRQEAEERAGKVGVKLVFPIFFCIMPSLLVVVAGPGVLQIFRELLPTLREFQQGQG